MPPTRRLVAGLAAFALLLHALAPMTAFASVSASSETVVVCTAHGMVEVPAAELDGRAPPPPAAADPDCCMSCRLAGHAPALPPPTLAPAAPIAVVLARLPTPCGAPARDALPPGSLAARSPPASV